MNASLLDKPPMSGTIEEVPFHAFGDCAWVLFEPDDAEDWVGVFGTGSSETSSRKAVAILETSAVAYIVAAGKDYLIDCTARDLRRVYDDSHAQGVIAVPHFHSFIVWNWVKLHGINADGNLLWLSRRVSWDGIRNVHLEGDVLVGEACTPAEDQWVNFTLDPNSGKFTGGSYVSGPWDKQGA